MISESLEALIDLLGQERLIYDEMAELLDQEREAMLAMAMDRLGEVVARKETLVLRIKALDESRKVLARRLGTAFSLPPTRLALAELCHHAPPPYDEELDRAGRDLRTSLEHCQSKNEFNARAARRGLELINTAIHHMIDQSDPAGKVYHAPRKRGRLQSVGGVQGQSGFISRQI